MFAQNSIRPDAPGFYDDDAFAVLEKRNPAVLEKYSLLVHKQTYSADYLARAERIVRRVAAFLHGVLKRDGREGACIDASLTLTRFLERQRVWNTVEHGAMTILPEGLPPRHFWPIRGPLNRAKTGHAWVCAPPFRIVDITVGQQGYPAAYRNVIPETVLAVEFSDAAMALDDLFEPDALAGYVAHFGRMPDWASVPQNMKDLEKALGSVLVHAGTTGLKYVPTSVTAPVEQLEEIRNFCPSEPSSAALYDEFLRTLDENE